MREERAAPGDFLLDEILLIAGIAALRFVDDDGFPAAILCAAEVEINHHAVLPKLLISC